MCGRFCMTPKCSCEDTGCSSYLFYFNALYVLLGWLTPKVRNFILQGNYYRGITGRLNIYHIYISEKI